MTVYVDDCRIPYRGMRMCHVLADSSRELLAAATAVGLRAEWLQEAGTPREHFDASIAKRRLLVENGAVEISRYELVEKIRERRGVRKKAYRVKGR